VAVLLSLLLLVVFHLFPALTPLFNKAFRYLFLVAAALALKALALLAIWQMFKSRDMTNLGRACFAFVTGIILGLLVGLWVEDPNLIDAWIQNAPSIELAAGSFVFGLAISELGTLTRRSGHPVLVFLSAGTAMILLQLLTLPDRSIHMTWLLVFLLGIGCDQMFRFEAKASRPRVER
jgi:hypothetical protein